MTNKNKESGRDVFMSSIAGLSSTLAVAITFFGVPPVYNRTLPYVQSFTAHYYGHGFEDLVTLGWLGVCTCTIFFLLRGSLAVVLKMGATAFALRFLA